MRRPARRSLALLLGTAVLAAGCGQGGNESTVTVSEDLTAVPSAEDGSEGMFTFDGIPDVVGTVVSGLDTPWGLDFLPDGRAVVTERETARVLLVAPAEPGSEAEATVTELGTVPGVAPRGEGGLLGVAVSPTFGTDARLYLYLTSRTDNRVVRVTVAEDRMTAPKPVLTGIPAGALHDGGRLEFGPDGHLYVSTGETGAGDLAQDKGSLAGKILRITTEGDPAPGNPFGTPVWSRGHRNVQGLAFDGAGQLWASELGDDVADELNRIVPGGNYGWPMAEGRAGPPTLEQPALAWSPAAASPSGLAFVGGYLWMAALRGERLWRVRVADGVASDPTPYFAGRRGGEYGRLRTVALAPDGRLWLATSNTDGRGEPGPEDDRILLVEP
ncbi:PQQ-dependent sugar dehydrogenase [Nocardioides sambongensis]|uniref:PQQ-dependent sugar dehydrogenase n=1 Tax=Nocardioides sambongensis TaxID=2589074 RepID=UPI0011280072|nr:PQQ-dependent sugar dehydrogenase [Nocardioides sambongensis]